MEKSSILFDLDDKQCIQGLETLTIIPKW